MDALFSQRNSAASPDHDLRRLRAVHPLASALRTRSALKVAFLRWLIISAVVAITTLATNLTPVGDEQCANTRSYLLIRVWVCIVTGRYIWGALTRGAIYFLWDTHATDDQQRRVVYTLVRFEFLVTLLSILLATVGFMWLYGTPICGQTPLHRFSTALVVYLYFSFLAPVLFSLGLRLALACGLQCCITLIQRGVRFGLIPIPPQHLPATQRQILALPQVKYRPADFAEDNRICAVCMETYESGDVLRVLPCDPRHHFHKGCLDQWLRQHANCPICRYSLLVPNADDIPVPQAAQSSTTASAAQGSVTGNNATSGSSTASGVVHGSSNNDDNNSNTNVGSGSSGGAREANSATGNPAGVGAASTNTGAASTHSEHAPSASNAQAAAANVIVTVASASGGRYSAVVVHPPTLSHLQPTHNQQQQHQQVGQTSAPVVVTIPPTLPSTAASSSSFTSSSSSDAAQGAPPHYRALPSTTPSRSPSATNSSTASAPSTSASAVPSPAAYISRRGSHHVSRSSATVSPAPLTALQSSPVTLAASLAAHHDGGSSSSSGGGSVNSGSRRSSGVPLNGAPKEYGVAPTMIPVRQDYAYGASGEGGVTMPAGYHNNGSLGHVASASASAEDPCAAAASARSDGGIASHDDNGAAIASTALQLPADNRVTIGAGDASVTNALVAGVQTATQSSAMEPAFAASTTVAPPLIMATAVQEVSPGSRSTGNSGDSPPTGSSLSTGADRRGVSLPGYVSPNSSAL